MIRSRIRRSKTLSIRSSHQIGVVMLLTRSPRLHGLRIAVVDCVDVRRRASGLSVAFPRPKAMMRPTSAAPADAIAPSFKATSREAILVSQAFAQAFAQHLRL